VAVKDHLDSSAAPAPSPERLAERLKSQADVPLARAHDFKRVEQSADVFLPRVSCPQGELWFEMSISLRSSAWAAGELFVILSAM
jgi:hypothetical protein